MTVIPGLEDWATPGLHPFFSYFGSKFKLSGKYAKPRFKRIIEPFAGAAGYALQYPDVPVKLYDIYEPVVLLWQYLIKVKESEIMTLPLGPFDKEHPVTDCNIAPEAKILIGFWLTESQTSASRYPLSKSRGGNWGLARATRIADQLKYIRHWTVEQKSYKDVDNQEATWFIDPPYELAGKRYKHKKIDYEHLGIWCQGRMGQVIVCEQEPAKWLPFEPLVEVTNASNNQYKEVIWQR